MSIGRASGGRARQLETAEFLDQLEDEIKHLARSTDDRPEAAESVESLGTGKEGNKRVSFNNKIHQRRFDKNTAVVEYKEDAELSVEEHEYEPNGVDEENEPSDGSRSEEDEEISSQDEDYSDDLGNIDLDSLSPAEQLELLMEHVDGDEEEEEDEDEDETDDFDYESEDDEKEDSKAQSGTAEDGQEGDYAIDAEWPQRKIALSLDQEEGNEDEEKKPKSSFERQQEKLVQRIGELEQESLAERPWMLRGEVAAKNRPLNSLLEQDLEFEHALRPAPIITEEVTESIESLIRQRIKDRAWDDVERRIVSQAAPMTTKRKLPELDGERSKKSLSEVYEEEHQIARQQSDSNRDTTSIDETTQKAHKEIGDLFKKICHRIDALSGFKFAPRSYTMEEITLKPLRRS